MPVLGLASCHWRKTGKLPVRFHRNIAASSLAADCNVPQRPPAELESPVHDWKNESVETKQPNHRLEVLHLFRWSTHTHAHMNFWSTRISTEMSQVYARRPFTHGSLTRKRPLRTEKNMHRRWNERQPSANEKDGFPHLEGFASDNF